MADSAVLPHPTPASRVTVTREVIDVDSLPDVDDDVLITQVRRAPPRTFLFEGRPLAPPAPASSSREDPIIVYDSDEEAPAGSESSNAQPPVVLPITRAFAWEPQPPRRAHSAVPPPPAPAAAPRSHHQPSMGLGGALIVLNRQIAIEEGARRRQEEAAALPQGRQGHTLGQSAINGFRHWMGWGTPPRVLSVAQEPWGVARNHSEDPDWADETFVDGLLGLELPKPPLTTPNWRPEYTHPGPPGAGFTYHFSDPDSPSKPSTSKDDISSDDCGDSSSGATSSVLVCAHCLDPLVLPTQDATAEESRLKRVWALRCGHLLDGKCVGVVMRPPAEGKVGDLQDEEYTPPNKGKGRARNPPIAADRKGKGKATDKAQIKAPASGHEPVADGSIRSRLRPRHNGSTTHSASLATVAVLDSDEENESSTAPPPTPVPRPAKASTRGKGAPKVAARISMGRGKKAGHQRYKWECPVAGCGKDHISALAPGQSEWTMDPHKGALAVYI